MEKKYKVIALSCTGQGKMHHSGEEVTAASFAPGHVDELVEKGFLEELPEDAEELPAPPADKLPTQLALPLLIDEPIKNLEAIIKQGEADLLEVAPEVVPAPDPAVYIPPAYILPEPAPEVIPAPEVPADNSKGKGKNK